MINVDMTRIIINQVKNHIQKRSEKSCDRVNLKFDRELFHLKIEFNFF